MEQIVIGLAGHIDHGKTALVRALTGINTDSQAEEIRRGMTIDIGFAFLTDTITLVDVPGHDRFVKNMVRGVAGIHMAMLVVAADDGVMPQTREHFQILRYLGVPRITIALNKIDLADPDWIELVEDDIRGLLSDSPYADSPILRVSGETGEGVEQLRETLLSEASNLTEPEDRGFFRLLIDRVFSIKGFGSIVTGTVTAGSLAKGKSVELIPSGEEAKIRGIQSHGLDVKMVTKGDRAALNIGNLSVRQLERGEQLAEAGYVISARQLVVELDLLASAPDLPHHHPVRVNVGTAEVMAKIKFVDRSVMKAGSRSTAILDLAEPTPVVRDDRFVLRSFSPVTTIGGGRIIDTEVPLKWKDQRQWVTELGQAPEAERLALTVAAADARPLTMSKLARRWGYAVPLMKSRMTDGYQYFGPKTDPWVFTEKQAQTLTVMTSLMLANHHEDQPLSRGLNREIIRRNFDGDEKFMEAWLTDLADRGIVKTDGDSWSMASFEINLSAEDNALKKRLVQTVNDQQFATGSTEELAELLESTFEQVRILISLAEADGILVRISPKLVLHRQTYRRLLNGVKEHFAREKDLTVSHMKAITGVSRKWAVPLLEHLDRIGVTVRIGDKRVSAGGE